MSLLKRMPRGLYSSYYVTGSFGTPPLSAPCSDIVIGGYKLGVPGATISKPSFKGVTITELAVETDYYDDGNGFCFENSSTLYLNFSGTAPKLKKIVDVTNAFEYVFTGTYTWAAFTLTIGPEVIIYY